MMVRNGQQISEVIDWLKSNFKQPVRVDDLASRARMSTSAFHHQFRSMTALSPLQYQKKPASERGAAFEVGYENPAQFSREYKRTFGIPPKRNITKLRRMTAD